MKRFGKKIQQNILLNNQLYSFLKLKKSHAHQTWHSWYTLGIYMNQYKIYKIYDVKKKKLSLLLKNMYTVYNLHNRY